MTSRIRHIDGLRGLAVLLVVAHHATSHSNLVRHGYAGLSRLTVEGAHGVDLFFVLSGFCLSYPVLETLLRQESAVFDVCGYLSRRVVRIVPPYYAAIALFALVPALRVSPLDLVKQALFLDWKTHLLNGSFWTLCVEFRWYLIFPLALVLWARSPRLFLTVAAGVAAAYAFTRMRALDLGVLLPFLLGIAAAHLFLRPARWMRFAWIGVPVFAVCGLLLEPSLTVGTAYGREVPIFFEQTNPGWQLAMFALVLAAGYDAGISRVFSAAPLAAVGTISYSVYLVHEPLVTWIDSAVPAPLPVSIALAIAAAGAAGALFWFAFERPWCGGALKARAVAALQPVVYRLLRAVDAPRMVRVSARMPLGESPPEFEGRISSVLGVR